MKKADFTGLRKKIDRTDRAILCALTARFGAALEIGRIKAALGIPVVQKSRLREVLRERVAMGRELGLSPVFVRALIHLIHDESVRMQKKVGRK